MVVRRVGGEPETQGERSGNVVRGFNVTLGSMASEPEFNRMALWARPNRLEVGVLVPSQ